MLKNKTKNTLAVLSDETDLEEKIFVRQLIKKVIIILLSEEVINELESLHSEFRYKNLIVRSRCDFDKNRKFIKEFSNGIVYDEFLEKARKIFHKLLCDDCQDLLNDIYLNLYRIKKF